MDKNKLYEIADMILSDSDLEPDWEMDLIDCFAAYYGPGIMGNDESLVIFQNNLSGEIEDVQVFADEEEAETYCTAKQQESNISEEEQVDEWL